MIQNTNARPLSGGWSPEFGHMIGKLLRSPFAGCGRTVLVFSKVLLSWLKGKITVKIIVQLVPKCGRLYAAVENVAHSFYLLT